MTKTAENCILRVARLQKSLIAIFKGSVFMDDLLQQGVIAYKAGKRDEARKIFIALVKQEPNNELAWGWMYSVANDDKERIDCMKQVVRINPKNEKASQLLNKLLAPATPMPHSSEDNPPATSTKKCPYCAEEIRGEAIVCKHCGRNLQSGTAGVKADKKPRLGFLGLALIGFGYFLFLAEASILV
jgi:tetratricopeptide (TPR) repeat protein